MAQDKKTVLARIQNLGGTLLQSVSKETDSLHEILHDGEELQAVASGLNDNKTKLLVITDSRILMLYHGMMGGQQTLEIPLAQVKSVSSKSGMLLADVFIDTGGQMQTLANVSKELAQNVTEAVSRLLHRAKTVPAQGLPKDDTISALERLAALHEKGVLTAEEFATQKAALLGQASPPIADAQPAATPQPDPAPIETVQQEVAQPPKSKKILTWKKAIAFIAILFIGIAIIGGNSEEKAKQRKEKEAQAEAAMTPEQKLARYLAAVKKVDSTITDVQLWDTGNDTRTLGVFYTKDIVLKTFYTIGQDCEGLSKKLVKKGLIDDNMQVLYFVHVPTVDKLGNKGTGLAMKIAWAGATLRKINWDNMYPPDFMNLSESVEMRPMLRREFQEFVQDKDNVRQFNDFIRLVLASHNNL